MTYSDKEIFDMLSRKEISGEQAFQMLSGSSSAEEREKQPISESKTDEDEVFSKVYQSVLDILHAQEDEVAPSSLFHEIGVDSISSVEIVREINNQFGLNLDAVAIYDYPTINELYQYVLLKVKERDDIIIQAAEMHKAAAVKQNHDKTEWIKKSQKKIQAVSETENIIDSVQDKIMKITQQILHMEEEFEPEYSFKEIGVDSISSVEIIRDINRIFDLELDAVTLYDYPTITKLSLYVMERIEKQNKVVQKAYGWKKEEKQENVKKEPENKQIKDIESSNVIRTDAAPLVIKGIGKPMYQGSLSGEKLVLQKLSEEPASEAEVPVQRKIAIIGMAIRVPGADNAEKFWSNMEQGKNSIEKVPEVRWNYDDFYDPTGADPSRTNCNYGGFLKNIDLFDPLFFNISPIEAQYMDPQQRIILEESWKAIEDAGYSNTEISGVRCGVYVGTSKGDYAKILEEAGEERRGEAFTGMSSAVLAARISYYLNLKGPSIAIDTACSSSLVAIHQACQGILSGECDLALAGGVRLMITPEIHVQSANLGIISSTNQCRAFDQSADGIVLSEGAGMVLLKDLSQAKKDNDRIYAVVEGSLVNQDGKTNGITAPSKNSQIELETALYKKININPEDISLIECHGTGTKLGDPIEVKALTETFRKWTDKKGYCAIGSVKTNVGHLSTAAGVASVIKVVLSMKHKKIPPVCNYHEPNEHMDLENSPFYINKQLIPWINHGKNRIAAVSSFGFSGTNCHLVIGDFEEQD